MTILSLIQEASRELKINVPTSVIGSTDDNVVNLLAFAEKEGKHLRKSYPWVRLTKEYPFTTSNGVASYAMPGDIDYEQFQTHWDRTNSWPLRGPLTPQAWQDRVSGINTVSPRSGFRIKGYADQTIFIEPTPTDTRTLVFEYQTKSWIRPVTWTASTAFDANSYCFYNGNIYSTTAGGTTGATAPTHTSSSASDGGVTWVYVSSGYETFTADTDVCHIDEEIIKSGIIWRWKRENGFEWESYRKEHEAAVKLAYSSQKSAPILSLTGNRVTYLLGPWSLPDTGYGS